MAVFQQTLVSQFPIDSHTRAFEARSRMPFLPLNQQCQSTEGFLHVLHHRVIFILYQQYNMQLWSRSNGATSLTAVQCTRLKVVFQPYALPLNDCVESSVYAKEKKAKTWRYRLSQLHCHTVIISSSILLFSFLHDVLSFHFHLSAASLRTWCCC